MLTENEYKQIEAGLLLMDLDADARTKICEFISTFIATQPISVMTTRELEPISVKNKSNIATTYSAEDMAKTISNRGNDIFGGAFKNGSKTTVATIKPEPEKE